jgi:hypothetical protein
MSTYIRWRDSILRTIYNTYAKDQCQNQWYNEVCIYVHTKRVKKIRSSFARRIRICNVLKANRIELFIITTN